MLTERSAGCVLFRDTGTQRYYLLLHYTTGHWDFPKGNIEEGERDVDTVVREVEEETGIADIEFIPGFMEVIKYFYRRSGQLVDKQVVFYLACTHTDRVTISHEHIGFTWLAYEDALAKLTYENSRRLFTKARTLLEKT